MLHVNLAKLYDGPVSTTGEVAQNDRAFAGLKLSLASPVSVTGRFSAAGDDKYYWRVQFETTVRTECRRCLAEVVVPIKESRGLIFSADEETPEGEGCYAIPAGARDLDLTEALREEVFLAVPAFVECRPDCQGLCPRCGADLNDGPCSCPPAGDPRWDALKGLSEASNPKKD
jgi:uncharacterized protein